MGEFTILRILILLGIARAAFQGLIVLSLRNNIDRLFIAFPFFALFAARFHETEYNYYISQIGLSLNIVGAYIYGKAYLKTEESLRLLAIWSYVSIIPLSLCLAFEATNGRNLYYPYLGARHAMADFREGFRAQGPFAHSILAGTSGAATFALFAPYWKTNRLFSILGTLCCITIIISANSSGPIAATLASAGVLFAWRWRHYARFLKWYIITAIIMLSIYMDRPFYYVMDSIDFTGGSTGWHRARLIEMSIQHLEEWWLFGTDYTRHWMPTGVSWNPNHTDITNYYIHLGVTGGLALTIILILSITFSYKKLLLSQSAHLKGSFSRWCLIAALISHAATFISVSYFDQMYATFYLLIALISNLPSQPTEFTASTPSKTPSKFPQ